ncbi:8186_t:CDS:2, partial [Dentiscutata erythropus]
VRVDYYDDETSVKEKWSTNKDPNDADVSIVIDVIPNEESRIEVGNMWASEEDVVEYSRREKGSGNSQASFSLDKEIEPTRPFTSEEFIEDTKEESDLSDESDDESYDSGPSKTFI